MMKTSSLPFVLACGFFFGISGCATVPEMTAMQRRAIQTRTFEDSSYDSVFQAFRAILQDEGYVVKNQDKQGGLIVATIEQGEAFSELRKVTSSFGGGSSGPGEEYRTGEGFEVSVNFDPVTDDVVEVRMTIQKVEFYNHGGRRGSVIVEEESYKSFFDKVRIEVERRKARGRA